MFLLFCCFVVLLILVVFSCFGFLFLCPSDPPNTDPTPFFFFKQDSKQKKAEMISKVKIQFKNSKSNSKDQKVFKIRFSNILSAFLVLSFF